MESARSDFSRHVRASFRKQKIMRLFQARISRVERGLVEISAVNRPDLQQQDGFVHAGALVALADSAGGYAALTLLPSGSRVLSVEIKLNFLRPAVGSMIRGRGRVKKIGRSIAVCELEAMMKQDQKWVTCAWGSQTIYGIRNQ
ncbi:PaaI family thioesterase [Candidatus Bathyarchaeota archaeon]|nr:MAG: PaaI family thioesterase [Candidatus Bathyarchaeota archaeon]